jgi:hypothetical protein
VAGSTGLITAEASPIMRAAKLADLANRFANNKYGRPRMQLDQPSETLPKAVAVAAYEFITGPFLRKPYRVGKRL